MNRFPDTLDEAMAGFTAVRKEDADLEKEYKRESHRNF